MEDEGENKVIQKMHGGYTYWKRETPDAHLLPCSIPKRIESEKTDETATTFLRPSAWNSANTWEEKECFSRFKQILEHAFTSTHTQKSGEETVTNTNSSTYFVSKNFPIFLEDDKRTMQTINMQDCEGEASVCFRGSKHKLGFDVTAKIDFEGCFDEQRVEGTVNVKEWNEHDDDIYLEIELEVPDERTKQREISEFVKPVLKSKLCSLRCELRDFLLKQ